MLLKATVGVVILLFWLFVGLPYYQAYKRRKNLKRLGRTVEDEVV